jgi:phospholipid/cholesterol/gamma-HCH transport system substrate-binding protein
MNRQRALGLVFVVLLTAALSLSVLQYRKAFTPVTWVTLETARTGMQLSLGADVKLHGVIVGEVRGVHSDGGGARLRLALDPALTGQIPAGVSARLLPKTLFGERYVALVAPAGPPGPPIRDGAVIPQDRSRSAVELEQVLDDALPLLQSIRPDRLAATLGALATALEGRGDQLGGDLVTLQHYLAALNQQLPVIADDVRRLATVLDVYDGALPDLLSILRDVTVTATTVTDQRDQLAAFLADTTEAADVTTAFLDRHGDQIIQLGTVGRPLLELLAAYAPEYPCLLRGLVALQPRVEQTFSGGRMHITLEVTRDGGKYLPGRDDPVYGAHDGPDCRGLPDPAVPAPQVPVDDGYDRGGARAATPKVPVGTASPAPGGPAAQAGGPAAQVIGDTGGPGMGYAGTDEERKLLKPLIGAATGVAAGAVPDIAVLLWGPLLRGTVVNTP